MALIESPTKALDALLEECAQQVVAHGGHVTPAALLTHERLRTVPDDELRLVVEEQGIALRKEELAPLVEANTMGSNVAMELRERYGADAASPDADLALLAIVELCLRWYPDWVCKERLENLIAAGYGVFGDPHDVTDARMILDAWADAWALVPELARRWHVLSTEGFDRHNAGVYLLGSWLLDYDNELSLAAVSDERYRLARVSFAREFEKTFPGELYDVLGIRFLPDGSFWSKYDEMLKKYESAEHVVPFVDEASRPISDGAGTGAVTPKVGRNDPCPCGSGKKYKKCCGRPSSTR